MKNTLRSILTIIAAGICGEAALAIPADPRPHTFIQPDGTAIVITKRGDERGHIVLSEDGYLLVEKDNALYYADVDASGTTVPSVFKAKPQALRSAAETEYLAKVDMQRVLKTLDDFRAANPRMRAPQRGPGLFSDCNFPAYGQQKVLVILVDFPNKSFRVDEPLLHFTDMLSLPGYSDYGGTGSAYDYFVDNSCGKFTPEFDVYGPVTMSHNYSYYGKNDWSGNDQHPEEMIIEACQQLDDTVDFSQYDRDGDGFIDNVYVFYAGKGEASYGGADTVWPHSWNITYGTDVPYYFDGVQLDRYACSNEWEDSKPDGIGTFVHEFSHVLGLPDLYATSYSGAFTPGAWSILDVGPYNNDGRTPPAYGAFERYALDWIEPTVIDSPADLTLEPIYGNAAYIIPTSNKNEYFLLENRQQIGWDTYIPGHGMLVWHVHYNQSVWTDNTVNNKPSHQYVDIEEADNKKDEYSRDGDAFPGTANIREFTDDTKPSMRTWASKALGMPLTEITEDDGVITFKVAGGASSSDFDRLTVEALAATDVEVDKFTARWTEVEGATDYLLSIYVRDPQGQPMTDSCDFTGGLIHLPEGWTVSFKQSYTNEAYCGAAAPALCLNKNNGYLQSPTYDADICSLKFWLRGNNAYASNTLLVKALVDEAWVDVAEVPIVNDEGGKEVTVNDFLAGSRCVQIVYNEVKHSGAVAIDDVEIGYGMVYENKIFGDYDAKSVGNVASIVIDGTAGSTTYYYYVVATDGEKFTLPSNEVKVTTCDAAGLGDATLMKRIHAAGTDIHIEARAHQPVKVYDIYGRQIFVGNTPADGHLTVKLCQKGLYIVRIGDCAYKFSL